MSEGSLPPFKYLDPRRYPSRIREAAGRLLDRLRRGESAEEPGKEPGKDRKSGPEDAASGGSLRAAPESRGAGSARHIVKTPENTAGEVGEAARRRAEAALREHLGENATNLDRAVRMRDQAERLDDEGTPSDSARNRADRAREEVADGIARLRRGLISSSDEEAARALDREVLKLDPPIQPHEIR